MSTNREKIHEAAQRWVDRKRYDRAIEEYQKIIQQDPKDARTLLKIGDLQARMQAYDQAIATYDRVGQFYASQGFALKAIAVYKQIRELIRKHAPQLADRYGYIVPKLAEIYTQLGLTSDALSAWDEVAARYQRSNQDAEAIEVFQKMVTLDATNPLPHLRLAEACCRTQDLNRAVESFWTAAELLLKLERRDDALKVVERILHFKQDPKYARTAAELYLQKGGREDGLQALAKLQIAFQADPRDLDTLSLLAQAFTLIGQAEKSIEVYKEMARIAREAEKPELFSELIEHLQRIAPNDDGVRALMAQGPPTSAPVARTSSAPPSGEPSAVSVVDEDVEYLDDEPFQLKRPSRPPGPPGAIRPPMVSAPDVVVLDNDPDMAGVEFGGPQSFDAQAHVRKSLVDAESFRKLRLYSKAIETLQISLEINPGSVEVREKLREILGEAGDRDAAIGESVTLAALYLERGDPARAEVLLFEVLEYEPEHPAALEMLTQISGGGQPSNEWQADENTDFETHYAPSDYEAPSPPEFGSYRSHGPLPSYDLEEVSASSAMASPAAIQTPKVNAFEMDDPFAIPDGAPLPSFPLGAEDAEDVQPVERYPQARPTDRVISGDQEESAEWFDNEPIYADSVPPSDAAEPGPPPSKGMPPPLPRRIGRPPTTAPLGKTEAPAEPSAPAHPLGEPTREVVEEALEEADFFASRGLYDDAKAIITDQLARAPTHPLLRERLREIEHLIAASVESQTIDRSQLGRRKEREAPPDRSFDIAASLEALDNLAPAAPPAEATHSVDNLDVERVFQKFKEGVRAQVSENDSATHYDLGVAYKEMGLLTDAMNAFELAARDPTRECMCFGMVGMIRLERGELDWAAKAYIRALEAQQKTVDQEMALYYDLGNVYEMKGLIKDALYYFQKIARRDPGYRGVSDRIAALQPSPPAQASRAVNDDDEFDRVFDDLFEK